MTKIAGSSQVKKQNYSVKSDIRKLGTILDSFLCVVQMTVHCIQWSE